MLHFARGNGNAAGDWEIAREDERLQTGRGRLKEAEKHVALIENA